MQVPHIPMTKSQIGRSSKYRNPFIDSALTAFYGSLRTFVASDPRCPTPSRPARGTRAGAVPLATPDALPSASLRAAGPLTYGLPHWAKTAPSAYAYPPDGYSRESTAGASLPRRGVPRV